MSIVNLETPRGRALNLAIKFILMPIAFVFFGHLLLWLFNPAMNPLLHGDFDQYLLDMMVGMMFAMVIYVLVRGAKDLWQYIVHGTTTSNKDGADQ